MANNIFAELLAFSKELAPWQNEAIRRLFTKVELSVIDRDEIFKLAKIEYGLEVGSIQLKDLMLKPTDLPAPPSPGQKIQLNAVRDLVNVNVLKGGERLAIGKQLTIIYGESASGKSGYARVMKKAFRARAVDPILPNVYAEDVPSGPASATFEIEENGVVRNEKWTDGMQAPESLGRFAVFDSKCARAYINEHNQLAFLPYGFDIIEGLGSITADVKKRYQDLATASAPKPETLKPLIDGTSIGKLLTSITIATNEEEIKTKAVWNEEDTATLEAKELRLAKLRSDSPQTVRERLSAEKKQLEAIRSAVISVSVAISTKKLEEIKTKVAELIQYEQAVEAAGKLAFGDLDLAGIGSEAWRKLLLAAETYSTQKAYPGVPFPPSMPGAKCVLCLRPLDEDAQQRLKRFWDFIKDDTSNKRDIAKNSVELEKHAFAKLPLELPQEIAILEGSLHETGPKLFEDLRGYYMAAAKRIKAIEPGNSLNAWDSIPAEPKVPTGKCNEAISSVDQRLSSLVDDAKVTGLICSLESEIAELKARRRLKHNLSTVLDYLRCLKLSTAAMAAANKITTNAISLKAGDLQNKFVTEEFKKRVQAELQPFGLVRVKAGIDRKSEKGKVLHRLTIEGVQNASPESVFSEGERSAVAIACFLAELSASEDNCGIIFDDPVSSFDHRIRAAVVDRLVAEAAKRQAIIFTHDLVCYRDLARAAKRQEISVHLQNVEALGATAGILSGIAPWDVLSVGQRIQRLQEIVKQAQDAEIAGDPTAYRNKFREFYDLLRSTWERTVEEILFNQVVQRLEDEVKTKSLTGVVVDKEAVEAIHGGMTRASKMTVAHDHAVAQNAPLPTSVDLAKDLNELKAFVEKQKVKRKAAEQQYAHLK